MAMKICGCFAVAVLLLFGCARVRGQAAYSTIAAELNGLRAVSDAQRPASTTRCAMDIRALPAGRDKLGLADARRRAQQAQPAMGPGSGAAPLMRRLAHSALR